MAIDYDSFVKWCEDKFDGQVITKGKEVKINSIFTADHKYHLWCSVEGGKYKREDGVYHCWKTGNKGTLMGLVMQVEGCTYQEAQDILEGGTSIRVLEEKLHEFFENKQNTVSRPESKIKLPEETYPICDLSYLHRREAEDYITNRRLQIDGLYYCTGGEYRSRIVIPYYDQDGKLIYFNARHVGKSKLRYMGPPKTCGVGKSDVLFAQKWPPPGSKVYLTEGEFDAMTLNVCGMFGIACGGKNLSDKQLEMLRPYKVCLALDADDTIVESASPGLQGMMEMGRKLLSIFVPTTFVRPPKQFKDWNKMLIVLNAEIVSAYIEKCEKPFDPLTIEQLMCMI